MNLNPTAKLFVALNFEREEDITSSALLDYFRKLFPGEDSKEIRDGKSFNRIASERAERFINANPNRFAPFSQRYAYAHLAG